jgi:hypothetical protein
MSFCSTAEALHQKLRRIALDQSRKSEKPFVCQCQTWHYLSLVGATVYRHQCREGELRKALTSNFAFFTFNFFIRLTLFPPPPADNSTLIFRPSSTEWCRRSPDCSPAALLNSKNAHPLDLSLVAVADEFCTRLVSCRTVGGGSREEVTLEFIFGFFVRSQGNQSRIRTHRIGKSAAQSPL